MNENNIINKISSAAVTQHPQQEGFEIQTAAATLQDIAPQRLSQPVLGESVRQTALRDLTILSNLMRTGIINPVQGQHLVSYVLNKAQETVNQQEAMLQNQPEIISGIADFETENPEFFKQNGRAQVLDYLKNSNAVVDKDEILQISKLVEALEKNAIEGYLQKEAHEKSLNAENEAAKQKLRANAQNSNMADATARIFTREQIGKMSGAEFARNEKAIMEQVRKGLVR